MGADGRNGDAQAGGGGLKGHAGRAEVPLEGGDLGHVGQIEPARPDVQTCERAVVEDAVHQVVAAKGAGSITQSPDPVAVCSC